MFRPFLLPLSVAIVHAVQHTAIGTVGIDGSVDLDLNMSVANTCTTLYASWCASTGCAYCSNPGIKINVGTLIPILEFCCDTCALPVPCTTTTTTTAGPPPAARMETVQLELDHWNQLNALRAAGFSCPDGTYFPENTVSLKWHCRLFEASQWHSQDMATENYFSHTGQTPETSPWERAAARGTSANGENIAAGRSSAAAVLEQWKNSNGHCLNMGNANFKSFAVGYGYNAGSEFKHYWTQMFSTADTGLDETSCLHTNLLQTNAAGPDVEISEEDIAEADDEDRNHDETKCPIGEPANRED